jgi:hypothetical protein
MMQTVLLTRIIPGKGDKFSNLSQVKKHIAYLHKGIKRLLHPSAQKDVGEVVSFLHTIKEVGA